MQPVSYRACSFRFRLLISSLYCAALLMLLAPAASAQSNDHHEPNSYRHHIELFPIVAAFGIYSAQYSYQLTPQFDFIVGFSYVNIDVNDNDGDLIGKMSAPTIPVGLRMYFWRNAHVEYQLWPAYNSYHDRVNDRYHNGFDLYSEIRIGYRFDFFIRRTPLFANLQYVYGIGLYPGNKPDNYLELIEDAPPFHVPSLSIGMRF